VFLICGVTACLGLFVCLPLLQGFEIGSGFSGARMTGSEHNDPFYMDNGAVRTRSNRWRLISCCRRPAGEQGKAGGGGSWQWCSARRQGEDMSMLL
jgi:hypothetical protein